MKRALWIVGGLLLAILAYAAWVVWGLPPRHEVRALARKNPDLTGVMRQRADEARRAKRPVRRDQAWVPLGRISRNLVNAVVAAEDPKFFGHEGIDWDAVRESAEADWKKKGFVRGGSTITQQVAKNLFFTTHKSVARKLREVVVARWLEADLGKKRILEIYLNIIEWGDGMYGCEAAARRYYGTSAADLSEDEAAGLAAMIPSPRRLNPLVDRARHAQAQRRVLWLMAHLGYVKRDIRSLGAEPPPPPALDDGIVDDGVPAAPTDAGTADAPAAEPTATAPPASEPQPDGASSPPTDTPSPTG